MKEIILANSKLVALVDDDDFELLSRYKWTLYKNGMAVGYCSGDRKRTSMHRFILQPKKTEIIDHINHNTLDNRRVNLRIATNSQNQANRLKQNGKSSKYKGVSLRKRCPEKPFEAGIKVNGKTSYLGNFANEEQAARAYDNAARIHFGEFAFTNFPK